MYWRSSSSLVHVPLQSLRVFFSAKSPLSALITGETVLRDYHSCLRSEQFQCNSLGHSGSSTSCRIVKEHNRNARNSRPHRKDFPWTELITEHTKRRQGREALRIYQEMREEGLIPSPYTFVAVLKACTALVDLKAGKEIHAHVIESGNQSDVFVATTLVDMYVKCGSMADACQVFEEMPNRDVVSWNAMIIGYAQMEKGELGLQLFSRMQHDGFTPNDRTFVAALNSCSSLAVREEHKEVDGEALKIGCLEKGRAIHSQVAKNGFESDVFVANALVDMYVKCGSVVEARQVFEQMVYRNVVSWNSLIIGYAQLGKGDQAVELYARMQRKGFTPNDRTFVAVLKACSSLAAQEEGREVNGELIKIGCLEKGRAIHSQVAECALESSIFVATALVDMYVKCWSMVDARQVFEKMEHRDLVSWNAMIIGYAQMDKGDMALELYARMQTEGFTPDIYTFVAALKACSSLAAQEGSKEVDDKFVELGCLEKGRAIHLQVARSGFESNIFIATTLVDMYAKCGSMVDASKVFDRMLFRNVVSWNAMIMGYAQMEMGELALQFYECMRHEGFTPDVYTFVAVLKACSSLASLETGKEIHAEICRVGLEDEAFVATCLVDMYSKCGSMVDAQQLFDALPVKGVVTWNALIAGYSSQGDSEHVLDLFERMQHEGIQPVDITFVSVLTVCSHTGLVNKGQGYFQAMCSDYGIIPHHGHYSCMVDLLGRAGLLDEAVSVVKMMPIEPVVVIWITVLGSCRKWNNVEIGRHAFETLVRLDGKCAAAYVLMASIYVSACLWEESAKVEEMMRSAQVWNKPGQCWWTESAGVVHTFLGGKVIIPKSKIYVQS